MKKITTLLVAGLALNLTGCATIICGSKQDVILKSTPVNATVYVDGTYAGKTPHTAELKRKKSHEVSFKLDGYKEHTFKLERKFNAWYIGNVVFGGLIGVIVDPVTGAIYKLKPEEQTDRSTGVREVKGGANDLYIMVSMEKDGQMEQIGQLERE